MFKFITDPIVNTIEIAAGLVQGELPTSKQVKQLLSDGIEIVAIAQMFDVSPDVIEKIVDSE